MPGIEERIRERLFAMRDAEYQAFQSKLIPTLPPERVIGVRTPALRRYARELAGTSEAAAFLAAVPHRYYEENNLHGFLLERERDFAAALAGVEAFLPYVDNWATCDLFSPPVFARVPRMGGGGAVGGVLCADDGGLVFCHRAGQAARGRLALAGRAPARPLGAGQSGAESARKPPHLPGAEAGTAGIAGRVHKRFMSGRRFSCLLCARFIVK